MNELESVLVWVTVQNGGIQYGQSSRWLPSSKLEWEWRNFCQIELVWIRVLCKMAESKMAEFKMAAIIKLVRLNEWKYFLCKMDDSRGRNQDELNFFENFWVKLSQSFVHQWLNPSVQNCRVIIKLREWKQGGEANVSKFFLCWIFKMVVFSKMVKSKN